MILKRLKDNLLLILTLLGVIFGAALGFLLRPYELSDTLILLISYPGELFIRMLKMMILPLIISSLIAGSSSLNAKANGKLVLRTVVYFLMTSLICAIIGLVLAVVVHPGSAFTKKNLVPSVDKENNSTLRPGVLEGFLDLGRNMFPENIVQATLQQTQTLAVEEESDDGTVIYKLQVQYTNGMNTLGIIVFCLVFGSILGSVEEGRVVISFFSAIDIVVMKIVTAIMWFSPIGVSSIILSKILSTENLSNVMSSLGIFVVTVTGGILFYQLIMQNIFYFLIVKKNPVTFFFNLLEPLATSFATASTAATLPIALRCMSEKNKVDPRISKFVLPIGATVNMDGTSLFIALSTVFIAQINDVQLSVGEYATIAVTATATSIATASVPSASLVLMLILLTTVNLPASDVSLLFAVDWLLDRVRTTQNMLGDCYTAAIVEKWSGRELNDAKVVDSPQERPRNEEEILQENSKFPDL